MPGVGVHSRGGTGGWLFDQPYLLLSLTALLWSANTVIGRLVAGHMPPITFSLIRWIGAVLILLPFAAQHLMRDWPTIRGHAALMTVLALTGFSTYNGMAYYALQYTTALNGLLLQSTAPLFVALWTFLLFRDRLTPRQAGGICISLAGALAIICHGSLQTLIGISFNRGDLWLLLALLIYAFYTAALRKRPAMHPLSFLIVGMGWGAVLLVPATLWEIASGKTFVLDTVSISSIVYVCVFPSVLGYLCLNRGVDLIGANRAAPFMHLIPVFGSVLAIVLLGERFELYHAIGYALVLVGITVATRK